MNGKVPESLKNADGDVDIILRYFLKSNKLSHQNNMIAKLVHV